MLHATRQPASTTCNLYIGAISLGHQPTLAALATALATVDCCPYSHTYQRAAKLGSRQKYMCTHMQALVAHTHAFRKPPAPPPLPPSSQPSFACRFNFCLNYSARLFHNWNLQSACKVMQRKQKQQQQHVPFMQPNSQALASGSLERFYLLNSTRKVFPPLEFQTSRVVYAYWARYLPLAAQQYSHMNIQLWHLHTRISVRHTRYFYSSQAEWLCTLVR